MVLQRHFLLILSAFFLILSPCAGQEFFRIDNAQSIRTTKSVTTSHVILDGETIGTVVFEGPESAETNTPVTIISLLESNLPAYGPPLIEFETLAGVDAASAFKVLTPDLVWSSNKPGTYRILATAVNRETFRIKKQSAIITVGTGPGPDPPKPDDPAPIDILGLRVLFVIETADMPRLPSDQQSILYSETVRLYLSANCAKNAAGQPEWRILDQDTVFPDQCDSVWCKTLARPRTATPWVVISNGVTGFEGPLPANVTDFMALVRQYQETP